MEKQKTEKKNIVLKVVKICATTVFYLIILFIFLVSIANINAGKSTDSMPNIFGRGYLSVQSDSMNGSQKDSFKVNDMIVVKALNNDSKREKAAKDLKIGDVVTFYDKNLTSTKKLNTHRVVLIVYSSEGSVQSIYTMGDKYAEGTMKSMYYNGEYSLTMFSEKYGDFSVSSNVQMIDTLLSGGNLQEISVSDLRGTYVKTISGGGKTEGFIKQYGNVVILLPLFIFLLVEIYFFSKNVVAYRKEKYAETHADEIQKEKDLERERLKEELRREMLEELKKNEEAKNEATSEDVTKEDTKEEE